MEEEGVEKPSGLTELRPRVPREEASGLTVKVQ